MDEFKETWDATSAAFRTLSSTESEQEAEQARRVLESHHLPALGQLDTVLGAAAYGLLDDILHARARRNAIRAGRVALDRWVPST